MNLWPDKDTPPIFLRPESLTKARMAYGQKTRTRLQQPENRLAAMVRGGNLGRTMDIQDGECV